MPKRDDIDRVLIIGSGPIVIGQACEFDYSGTQACKALRRLGYEVVLVNSNPATIMTDPVMADQTFIAPLKLATLTEIIAKTRPDALLPNLGGQTALNLSSELAEAGVLDKYGVQLIGVQFDTITKGEDREAFKELMAELDIKMPRSETVTNVADAERVARELRFPVVLRPAYTMGGTGGGLVHNIEELRTVCARGLAASMVGQVLVEESVLGWQELELEVVRDAKDQMITVCTIENVDPMGVHTGDSFCVAPMLTVEQNVIDRLQEAAYRVVSQVGVIGGCNVQFGYDPHTDRFVIIEINPRTSRSSALASKATGFPIAMVSTLLAAGLTLDEIPYWRDGTLDKYTLEGDYVVVKFARWAFEKFPGAKDVLGTQMRAVGEVMSIGRDYKEAFQKAIRSLENGRLGLGFAKNFHELELDQLMTLLAEPSSERQYVLYEALRKGASVLELHERTRIDLWFLEQLRELVDVEEQLLAFRGQPIPDGLLWQAKRDGFADGYLAEILDTTQAAIRQQRERLGIRHGYQTVRVSGVPDAEYYYSSYHQNDQVQVSDRRKVLVLGGGPNRIGQGIEFDYCCVHAAYALRDAGIETVMVNCNPETVSTDYDTSDKLYFEPLTVEDVLAICEKEKPAGVICQFGGQTPLNIAGALEQAGVPILGTSPAAIDLAEDRDQFNAMMDKLQIPMPPSGMATTVEGAQQVAARIGYPVMVRPSYVLGGRGMEIVHDPESLTGYMRAAVGVTPDRPILIDRFLANAMECEADAICDGTDAFVPTVMQHVEYAGVHSGDSAAMIPPQGISPEHLALIEDYTKRIAVELGVVGLMNIQYAIGDDGVVYVLEANPRASRTVPLVSKVCNLNMAGLATRVMLGASISELGLVHRQIPYVGIKESVFPFNMFPEVDPVLGPEMRSTGEVLGIGSTAGVAYFRAQEAANAPLPTEGAVLVTLAAMDRVGSDPGTPAGRIIAAVRGFVQAGLTIRATGGTAQFLAANGIESHTILKLHQGRPNIEDAIINGDIQLVVNSPAGAASEHDDSYIRKAAIRARVPYITTTTAAWAAAQGILAAQQAREGVRSLQEYHAMLS